VEACDVILCNCYPFWEGTEFNHALQHEQYMYKLAQTAAKGKRVIITETGWP
ncbi:MAG TPA: glycosyl hydrolase, partial [Bacteroidales bacterium]|nr:glycosyl hydrolase [Bacteroidales bacterium]